MSFELGLIPVLVCSSVCGLNKQDLKQHPHSVELMNHKLQDIL